jgi:hypothetical protein
MTLFRASFSFLNLFDDDLIFRQQLSEVFGFRKRGRKEVMITMSVFCRACTSGRGEDLFKYGRDFSVTSLFNKSWASTIVALRGLRNNALNLY